jgi:hypothetical protein
MRVLLLLLLMCAFHGVSRAGDTLRVVVLHDSVGESIDRSEKIKYHLFPFWSDSAFDHAEIRMKSDSSMIVVGTMTDGTVREVPCTKENFRYYNFLVRYHAGLIPEEPSSATFGKFLGGAIVGVGSAIITYIQSYRGRR